MVNDELVPVPSEEEHHVLVQAAIAPVDVDGVAAAQLGTAAFAVLSAACLWFRTELAAAGNEWWLWTCLTGLVLGLVMVAYNRSRQRPGKGQANRSSTLTESQTGSGR